MGTAQSRIDESDGEHDEPQISSGATNSESSARPAPIAGRRRRRDSHDDQSQTAHRDARPSLRRRLLNPIRSSTRLHRRASASGSSASADTAAARNTSTGDVAGPPSEDASQEGGDVTRRLADALGMALLAGRSRSGPASSAGTESASRVSTASVPAPFHSRHRSDSATDSAPTRPRSSSMSRLSRLRLPLLARTPPERPAGLAPDPESQPAGPRPRRPGLGRGPGAGLDLGRMIHELSNLQRRLMAPPNGAPGANRPTEASLVTSGTYIVVQGVFMARYTPAHPHTTSPAAAATASEARPEASASTTETTSGQTSREASRDTLEQSSSPAVDPTSSDGASRASGLSEPEPQPGSGSAPTDRANAAEQGALLTRMITVAASAVATNLLDPAQIMSRTMRGSIPLGYARPSSSAQTEDPSGSVSTGQDTEHFPRAGSESANPDLNQPEPSAVPGESPGGREDDTQRADLPGMLRSALAGDTPGPGPAPHLHAESQPWPRPCATPTSGSEAAVLAGHGSPAGWTHASLESSLHRARAGRVDDGPAHTFDHWLHMLSTDLVAAIERAWAHRRGRQPASTTASDNVATEGGSANTRPSASVSFAGPSETLSATQVPNDADQRREDDVTDDEIVFLRMFRFDPQPAPASPSDDSTQHEPSAAPAASASASTSAFASDGASERQQTTSSTQAQAQSQADGAGAPDNLVPHLVVGIRSTHLPAESGASEGESAPVRYSILITGGYYEPSHPLRTQPLRGPGREMMYLMELLSTLQTFAGSFSPSVKKATQAEIDASNTVVLTGREAIAHAFEQGQIQGGEADHCCSVCYDEWADDCRARVLPCKHIFHTDCVDRWITQASNSCPLCRREAVPSASSPPSSAARAPAEQSSPQADR